MLAILVIAALAAGSPSNGQSLDEQFRSAYEAYQACLIEGIRALPDSTTALVAAPLLRTRCQGQADRLRQVADMPDPAGVSDADRSMLAAMRIRIRSNILETDSAIAGAISESRLSLTSNLLNQPPILPAATVDPLSGRFLVMEVWDPLRPTVYLVSVNRTRRTGRYATSETLRAARDGRIATAGHEYDCEAKLQRLAWVRSYDRQQRLLSEELNTVYPATHAEGSKDFAYACSGSAEGYRPVVGDPLDAFAGR